MTAFDFLGHFFDYMNSGGFVMWPLFVANFFMWYGLGYRFHALKRGHKVDARRLVEKFRSVRNTEVKGVLDEAVVAAIEAGDRFGGRRDLRSFLDDTMHRFELQVKRYSILVKTIVIVAPLTGLLGTVIGMIETFDSLQAQALFTQGGGIAAGISQALFTTQMGLGVAIPGLIIGRILDRREQALRFEFEQVKDVICTQGEA
jgi:biopolymer transport protein ExbB